MRRREFLALLSGIATEWPLAARAQAPSDRTLIGYLAGGKQPGIPTLIGAFREELRKLGYEEGRNIEIAYRFAEGRPERLPALAEELVRLNPRLIVAGAVDAAVATKNVSPTIPIVSPVLADPINLGLVASYARPGSNITGIMPYIDGLPAKQMELALEILPSTARVGLLGNLNDPKAPHQQEELQGVARKLRISVVMPEVRAPEDIDPAMRALTRERVDVLIVLQTTMLLAERRQIAELAAANRLPAVYGYREHVVDGGLISYGIDLPWCFRRAATLVDKILKGAKPADVPIEFPSRLQLVINLKTADALGIKIPALLLSRADEVIE
jgi:putative ABC transport system substrate-binding protein